MVVHLDLFAQEPPVVFPLVSVRRQAREQLLEPVVVDEDGVGLAKVFQSAFEDSLARRRTNHRRVVEPEQDDRLDHLAGLPLDVVDLGSRCAFIERDRPEHPFDALDPVEVVLDHRLDIIDLENVGVHHPKVGAGRVGDLAGGPEHQAAKDRALLGDKQGGERQAHDDPEKLGAVARQHLKRNPAHPFAPFLARTFGISSSEENGGASPRAARVNRVMWSVRYSRSSRLNASPPTNRSEMDRVSL